MPMKLFVTVFLFVFTAVIGGHAFAETTNDRQTKITEPDDPNANYQPGEIKANMERQLQAAGAKSQTAAGRYRQTVESAPATTAPSVTQNRFDEMTRSMKGSVQPPAQPTEKSITKSIEPINRRRSEAKPRLLSTLSRTIGQVAPTEGYYYSSRGTAPYYRSRPCFEPRASSIGFGFSIGYDQPYGYRRADCGSYRDGYGGYASAESQSYRRGLLDEERRLERERERQAYDAGREAARRGGW